MVQKMYHAAIPDFYSARQLPHSRLVAQTANLRPGPEAPDRLLQTTAAALPETGML
jgi:hypothetical protein